MKEKYIETQLVKAAIRHKGIAVKFVSPGFDGMPDRLVLLPDGHCGFVELKAPGKTLRPLQVVRHQMLKNLGYKVFTIDNTQVIEEVLNAL